MTIYGIRNCDTMKKAMRWLDEAGANYHFHDYRKAGVDAALLSKWCKQVRCELLLNRRGTTWRKLDEASKQDLDEAGAVALMVEHPAMIKRPVLDLGDHIEVGYSAERYATLLT